MRLLTLILLFLLALTSIAGPVLRVPASERAATQLMQLGLAPLCGSTEAHWIVECPSDSVASILRTENFSTVTIANDIREMLGAEAPSRDEVDDYRSLARVGFELDSLARAYPTIMKVDTIGFSRLNYPIFHVTISDSVNVFRDVPVAYIVAGTHGNEMIGVEVVMEYLRWFLSNSASDTSIQRRLRSLALHVVPVLNPDGFAWNTRENGNFVDINRNFRFYWGWFAVGYGTAPLSEPETRCLDSLIQVIHPSIGISYHSYGEQVLRPYSYNRIVTRDEATLANFAGRYQQDLPMYRSMLGSDLYSHGGEHNDHCYTQYGFPSLTIEVWRGPNYNPPADSIVAIGIQQRSGISRSIDRVTGTQLSGVVLDSATRMPIGTATYRVVGRTDSGFAELRVHPITGRFRLVREAMTCTLSVSAPRYLSRTIIATIDSSGQPTLLNVALERTIAVVRGHVRRIEGSVNDTLKVRCQNRILVIDSTGNFLLDSLDVGVSDVVMGGGVYETVVQRFTLAFHDTAVCSTAVVRMRPPIGARTQVVDQVVYLNWSAPSHGDEARAHLRGYAIWRDQELYIPLTLDTTFAEPFTSSDCTRVYRLQTVYRNGVSALSDSLIVEQPVVVASTLPVEFGVGNAYPNPFNATLSVPFRLPSGKVAELALYDVLGKQIFRQTLHGHGVWKWSHTHDQLASGVYFLEVRFDSRRSVRKLALIQ